MAVAIDFTGASAGGVSGTSLTIGSVTIGSGSNRLLVVGVSQYAATDRAPTAVLKNNGGTTVGTLAVWDAATIVESPGTRRVTLLYLTAPSSVTNGSVVISWGGTVDEFVAGCTSWTGVDQTTPLGTASKHTGSTSPAGTGGTGITTASGNVIHDVLSIDAPASTSPGASANQTLRWAKVAASNTSEGDGQTAAGTGSAVVMQYTVTAGFIWAHIAAAINAASGGGGGGTITVPGISGIATVALSLGRLKAIAVSVGGTSSVTASLGRRKAITATAIQGVANATVTLGRIKAITVASIVGRATVSTSLGKLRAMTLATVSGNASVAATLHAIRSLTASSAGSSTVTVTLSKLAQGMTASIAGTSTVSATLHAKRAIAALVNGAATVNVTLGRKGSMALGAITGAASVAVTLVAIRSISATVSANATVTARLGKLKAFPVTAGGSSSCSVTLTARRSITVTVNAGSSVNLTVNARRAITVVVAGRASVFAAPDVVSGGTATTLTGKYKPEHDSALRDLGNATGFANEHASAVRGIADAGV